MIEPKIALFLTLDGKAQEAIHFYQETLDATLLFAITNQEYQEKLYQRLVEKGSQVIQAPSENPFAFFYASVRDPFGVIIQLTVEKEVDPSKKGE